MTPGAVMIVGQVVKAPAGHRQEVNATAAAGRDGRATGEVLVP